MKEISAQEFESLIIAKKSLVLHFWAAWNGYDVEQKKYLEVLEQETEVSLYQMNIDVKENFGLCKAHNVVGPPTIVFYKNGELLERVVGVMDTKKVQNKLCALNIV